MTAADQPRSATAALRDLLEQFHGKRVGGITVHQATVTDVTDRLNELAALERDETTDPNIAEGVTDILTAVRAELARTREQRDRALDLATQVITPLLYGEAASIDGTSAYAELQRLKRMRDGLDDRQPSTLYDAIHAALLNLADQLPGEPAPVLLAWGVEPLAERLTDAVEASGVMNGPTA